MPPLHEQQDTEFSVSAGARSSFVQEEASTSPVGRVLPADEAAKPAGAKSSDPPTAVVRRVEALIQLPPGSGVGEYEIECRLGAGAMGEVYAARHVKLGKRVAIKVISPSLSQDGAAIERFEQEARTLAQMHHPGLVLTALLAATAAGCSYGATFRDCEVTCTAECPSGFLCEANWCRATGVGTSTSCESIIGDARLDDARLDDASFDGGSASCPAEFGGARYLFVNTLMDWPAAEAYCKSLDKTPSAAPYVHLVVVNNASELGQLTPTGTPLDDAWLGYTDSTNPSGSTDFATIAANFRWVTDEQPAPGFAMWEGTEPDDSSTPRCGSKKFSDGLMYDRTCTGHTRTVFCECDAFPENPANL